MQRKEFTATLAVADRGAVRLVIPFDPTAAWGKKSRHAIRGAINGAPFEGTLGARGGTYFFPVNKALREAAGVSGGDQVEVWIEPQGDEGGRAALPGDFQRALQRAPSARDFFDSLSPFYQRTYVKWIEDAKRAETRSERIEKTLSLLKLRKKQR